jgi:hypothetical protein
MDEPCHSKESSFWDNVADWLLGDHEPGRSALTQVEIDALLRESGREPPARENG